MFGFTAGSLFVAIPKSHFPVAQSELTQQDRYDGYPGGGQGLQLPPQSKSLSSTSQILFAQCAGPVIGVGVGVGTGVGVGVGVITGGGVGTGTCTGAGAGGGAVSD